MIMKFDFLWYKFDVLFKTQIYLFYYLIYLKNILLIRVSIGFKFW